MCTLLLLVSGWACKKETAPKTPYEISLQVWTDFKSSAHNNYTYNTYKLITRDNHFGSEKTKITVENGIVTKRDFGFYKADATTSSGISDVVTREWHEDATTLGSHTIEGAELITMDDIYAKAKIWLAMDANQNIIYFETKNGGIISNAGYQPKDCTGDCMVAISISSVAKL
ncbi:hypothetical protein EWM62_00505 [Mucilaginibacter terrigena]|uniref:Uncharacterized protein n=1 Tax=Mucilaginibacter terrigena TaxID=2492395 RepID=A0A4Q5LR24_9SPHI|nr:hypothetical protein [Mucilaginibacter terrigena]RYU91956.1 hypothetical protein EWM62_00505 [Mucilaginibacter terrigena]